MILRSVFQIRQHLLSQIVHDISLHQGKIHALCMQWLISTAFLYTELHADEDTKVMHLINSAASIRQKYESEH